jgi:hypothetical protein
MIIFDSSWRIATVRVVFKVALLSTLLTGCSMTANPVTSKTFALGEDESHARLLEIQDLPFSGFSRDDEFGPEFQFGVNVCSNKSEFGTALEAQTLALRNWNMSKELNDYQPIYVNEVILKFKSSERPSEIIRNLRFCIENDEPNGLIPVLPPTAASTMAASVVGTATQSIPRNQLLATKPDRSVTAPPPTATIKSLRVNPAAPNQSSTFW